MAWTWWLWAARFRRVFSGYSSAVVSTFLTFSIFIATRAVICCTLSGAILATLTWFLTSVTLFWSGKINQVLNHTYYCIVLPVYSEDWKGKDLVWLLDLLPSLQIDCWSFYIGLPYSVPQITGLAPLLLDDFHTFSKGNRTYEKYASQNLSHDGSDGIDDVSFSL